jgi:hypothetical protein
MRKRIKNIHTGKEFSLFLENNIHLKNTKEPNKKQKHTHTKRKKNLSISESTKITGYKVRREKSIIFISIHMFYVLAMNY